MRMARASSGIHDMARGPAVVEVFTVSHAREQDRRRRSRPATIARVIRAFERKGRAAIVPARFGTVLFQCLKTRRNGCLPRCSPPRPRDMRQ